MNDDHFEKLIKESIHQHLQDVSIPPFSKEKTWNQIHERLYGVQDRKRRRLKLIAVSSLTGLMLVFFLLTPQSGAFDKLAAMFYQIQNTATQLFVSTEDPNKEINNLQEGTEFGNTPQDMNLHEAQKHIDFEIIVPEYIPEGFNLKNVTVMANEANLQSDHVIVNYVGKEGSLAIEQSGLSEGFGMGMSANTDNVEKMMVGVNEVMLIHYEDQSKEAYWTTEDLFISIYGYISEEDLIKIIESM